MPAMTKESITPKYLSIRGAQTYSGLGNPYLEKHVRNGNIDSVLVKESPDAKRGKRLIIRESLDAWIEKGILQKEAIK